jgi:putative FmdB family regulatory protein
MPVYEFRCAACGHEFSKLFRSVIAAADAGCPACQTGRAERIVSSFAYHASLQTRIDSIDPQIEKEIEAADSKHRIHDPMRRINTDFSGAGHDD